MDKSWRINDMATWIQEAVLFYFKTRPKGSLPASPWFPVNTDHTEAATLCAFPLQSSIEAMLYFHILVIYQDQPSWQLLYINAAVQHPCVPFAYFRLRSGEAPCSITRGSADRSQRRKTSKATTQRHNIAFASTQPFSVMQPWALPVHVYCLWSIRKMVSCDVQQREPEPSIQDFLILWFIRYTA